LGQAVRTQLVDGLLADLPQDVTFLRVFVIIFDFFQTFKLDVRWVNEQFCSREQNKKISPNICAKTAWL
jgi:hypothetical protein